MPCEAFGKPRRCFLNRDTASGNGIVSNNPPAAVDDVGPGRFISFVCEGEALEPIVQGFVSPAIEAANVV